MPARTGPPSWVAAGRADRGPPDRHRRSRDGLEELETGGLVVPIRGFQLGASPSLESSILQPADVPGGVTVLEEAFEGEFAEAIAG
ncbi:hypothetical protein [Blastococcus sp. SYSU DS0533]